MRVTKNKLDNKESREIEKLTNKLVADNKDITLAYDFSKDIYSILKEKINKRKIIKSYWEIFKENKEEYTKHGTMDLMKNVNFYGDIRLFLRYIITSILFRELDKLDPMEALAVFLKMFNPLYSKKGKTSEQQDQGGRSGDGDNLPIDLDKFRKIIKPLEKALKSGILEENDFQEYLSKNAGVNKKEINIGNIVDLIDKIAKNLSSRELEIFYVARKHESTEKYGRDEILESSLYPEDEMTVKNIENFSELLKLIPTQYVFDDDLFIQKLIKKELLVKDYQTRRLKKQALYLLIDVSGSMSGMKNVYACGVALSLIRQALDEGSTYFLRFFDDITHMLYIVKSNEDAKKLSDILIKQPFSGGGTSIQTAIKKAIEDIKTSPENFEKAEIMVISDGEDNVSIGKEELKNIKVHATIIDGSNVGLKRISETYTELSSTEL